MEEQLSDQGMYRQIAGLSIDVEVRYIGVDI